MNLPRLYPILDTASLAERGVSLETAAAAFYHANGLILKRTVYRIGPDGVIRFARRGMPRPEAEPGRSAGGVEIGAGPDLDAELPAPWAVLAGNRPSPQIHAL